jgi:Protein of unknown function (DUF2971)
MLKTKKDLEFEEKHPFPDEAGVNSLYKFTKVNDQHPEYLESLLIDLTLHHSLPETFNDPFECKPHWKWPTTAKEVREVRKRLVVVARKQGNSRKDAETFASTSMQDRETLETAILSSTVKGYRNLRICSYSTSNKNILLWSHYADSHKGICIGFDANRPPIAVSMKVHYQDDYPEIEYPLAKGAKGFVPALTKSTSWAYEQEFRSILVPTAPDQPPHNETSFFLEAETITNIYLGANISDAHRDFVLSLVARSRITPQVWQSVISSNSFSISFRQVHLDA